MDIETIKAGLPVLGGALGLTGGIFTFVSGRLKDADDHAAKANVVRLTFEWVSLALNFAGMLVVVFSKAFIFAAPFFMAAFALQILLFLRNPAPLHRRDVVVFSLMTSLFACTLVIALVFSVIDNVLNLTEKIIKVEAHRAGVK